MLKKVKILIEEKYAELTIEAINKLKNILLETNEEELEADFSRESLWEAFVDIVQQDDSAAYTYYSQPVKHTCEKTLGNLTPMEFKLLWLGSGGYVEWDDIRQGVDFPVLERLKEDVLEELMSWVEQKAADEDLLI